MCHTGWSVGHQRGFRSYVWRDTICQCSHASTTHCFIRCMYTVVCLSVCLSVTRVYCDKMAAVRIMQFSLKCSPMPCLPSLMTKFEVDPSIWGLKVGWGCFRLRDAVSRKRCEIELRWQLLITNRKSYIWAFDCNKSWWPWMTLNEGATVGYCQLSWLLVVHVPICRYSEFVKQCFCRIHL